MNRDIIYLYIDRERERELGERELGERELGERKNGPLATELCPAIEWGTRL